MKKIISFVGMFAVMGAVFGDAHGVVMNANIRRLLQEKQDKIAKLEECEGKKQGWMIAGISTIGLTAVGVGVNIAQASKSNRLSDEIAMEKTTLQREQENLNRIQNDIAKERAKQEKKSTTDSSVYVHAGGAGDKILGQPCGVNNNGDYVGTGTWTSCDHDFCAETCQDSKTKENVNCSCVSTTCLLKDDPEQFYIARLYEDDGETVGFASILCDGAPVDYMDSNIIGQLSNSATGWGGQFCLRQDVPDNANCTISTVGYRTLAGTMKELKDSLDGGILVICPTWLDLSEQKFGTPCLMVGRFCFAPEANEKGCTGICSFKKEKYEAIEEPYESGSKYCLEKVPLQATCKISCPSDPNMFEGTLSELCVLIGRNSDCSE